MLGLSDTPQKKHPWSKYYSERGVSRPPLAAPLRPTRAPAPPSKAVGTPPEKKNAISEDLAAAVAAATAALPGTTAAPFITILQKEALARELRRQARIRWAIRAGIIAAAAVMLHFAVTRWLYRAPSGAALQAHARDLAQMLVPLHTTPLQPLQAGQAVVSLSDRVTSSRIRYAAEVTMHLAQPLYVPAATNGTAAYRLMQQSLQAAREQDIKLKLFENKEGPAAPELPLLIQVAHRAGERMTVRVPFEARRFGWHWRIDSAQLALRTTNRNFEGATIDRYARVPHMIFGGAGTLAEIRRLTQLARTYIIAVSKEVQKHANAAAVEAPLDPALADAPPFEATLQAEALVDPNAPAFDPDAPAIEAAATAPVDRDAAPTTVDPNAPALDDPAAHKPAQAAGPVNRGR